MNQTVKQQAIVEKFIFRGIRQEEEEIRQAVLIEQICFPPNEACSEQNMRARIAVAHVLPKYRGQGLARELVSQYSKREQENNRHTLVLTCLKEKVEMYRKFGFTDLGIANSTWGGEEWHEMRYTLETE